MITRKTLAMYNMYDNLVTQAPNSTIIPHVASSWTAAFDGKTYTFILSQGIKFHSGNVLNASDVVFSMQRMLAIGEGSASFWVGILNSSGIKDSEFFGGSDANRNCLCPVCEHALPFLHRRSANRDAALDKRLIEQANG